MAPVSVKWVAAIDPGFGETGMVLINPLGHLVAYATWTLSDGIPSVRATSLATAVVCEIIDWKEAYKFEWLLVGLEMPIMKMGNAFTFGLQMRLIQEIEAGLWNAGMKMTLCEVSPTASKRILTGDGRADKSAMILSSPFKSFHELSQSSREALADAWAHSKAALALESEQGVHLHHQKQRPLDPIVRGQIYG